MTVLLVGFDSAWADRSPGAIVGALWQDDGSFESLGQPVSVKFDGAKEMIEEWVGKYSPVATLILIDQPIIVKNATGCRPVERIVSSIIGKCGGGVQTANKSKDDMFGDNAPVKAFIKSWVWEEDPRTLASSSAIVLETYPALAMIALRWCRERPGAGERLPKYNPKNKKKFCKEDWGNVCDKAADAFAGKALSDVVEWLDHAKGLDRPRKFDQDKLDACICLLVALHAMEGESLMVGSVENGYMVLPYDDRLRRDLDERRISIGMPEGEGPHRFRLVPGNGQRAGEATG